MTREPDESSATPQRGNAHEGEKSPPELTRRVGNSALRFASASIAVTVAFFAWCIWRYQVNVGAVADEDFGLAQRVSMNFEIGGAYILAAAPSLALAIVSLRSGRHRPPPTPLLGWVALAGAIAVCLSAPVGLLL